ncbi:hypothetical protein [Priestia aryabhattai]|uniref:hypothetical protein n=1 Tax=Priestia aryabhattai TaxID=412384 RepID=UPI003735889D
MFNLVNTIWTLFSAAISLILVWVYDIRIWTALNNHFTLNTSIPLTVNSVIDAGVLTGIIGLLLKLINKAIKKPVSIKVSIDDPMSVHHKGEIRCTLGAEAKKLKINVEIDYKKKPYKVLFSKIGEHVFEIKWNNSWIAMVINEKQTESLNAVKGDDYWYCDILNPTNPGTDAKLLIPIYFSINHDFQTKGNISTNVHCRAKNSFLSFLVHIMTPFLVECQTIDTAIHLYKGE